MKIKFLEGFNQMRPREKVDFVINYIDSLNDLEEAKKVNRNLNQVMLDYPDFIPILRIIRKSKEGLLSDRELITNIFIQEKRDKTLKTIL